VIQIGGEREKETEIGDRVRATMNGYDWFTGVYVENIDLFAQYGVVRDGTDKVVFFVHAETANHELPSEKE
jgi:hypothetical protein